MPMLLKDVASNTTSDGYSVQGPCNVIAGGSFNGGSAVIQVASMDDDNFATVHTFTEAGAIVLDMVGTYRIRAAFTGSGASVTVVSSN